MADLTAWFLAFITGVRTGGGGGREAVAPPISRAGATSPIC